MHALRRRSAPASGPLCARPQTSSANHELRHSQGRVRRPFGRRTPKVSVSNHGVTNAARATSPRRSGLQCRERVAPGKAAWGASQGRPRTASGVRRNRESAAFRDLAARLWWTVRKRDRAVAQFLVAFGSCTISHSADGAPMSAKVTARRDRRSWQSWSCSSVTPPGGPRHARLRHPAATCTIRRGVETC